MAISDCRYCRDSDAGICVKHESLAHKCAAPVPPALRELIAKLQADADNLRAKLSEQSGNLAILKKLLGADNAGTGLDGSRTLADCATQSGESRVVHAHGEAVAAEHACQWKDAIIDAAVVDWVYTAEHERNPRRAVNDLLAHQVILALNPAVSKEAADLHARIAELETLLAGGTPAPPPELRELHDVRMALLTWASEIADTSWHSYQVDLLRAAARLLGGGTPAPPPAPQWLPIDAAPRMRKLLVFYRNELGKGRTAFACYYNARTLELDDDADPDLHDYDDATGEAWASEGWYEEHNGDAPLFPLEAQPTHWMPLPDPPGESSGSAVPRTPQQEHEEKN